MRYKTIFTNCYRLADERMGLYAGSVTNHRVFLDFHEGAHEAIVADPAFKQVDGFKNFHIYAKYHITDLRF
jgi:hypothetical protein